METLHQRIEEAVAAIRQRCEAKIRVGIILGTGLDAMADKVQDDTVIPYGEIPNFPLSTVEFHAGRLVIGTLGGQSVGVMKGRHHCYEGHTPQEVTFPVRVLRALGAEILIVTNAVGGMNPMMPPGTIVAVTDHINLMGVNPLVGPNDDTLGPRFPDMSQPYDRTLIDLAERVALEQRLAMAKGVLVGVLGPNLETAAEYRMLRGIGADVVSMSMVPENIVAIHAGMRVLGFSVVTDACLPDALKPADISEIVRTANEAGPHLDALVTGLLSKLDG
ncbi:purine-nucleoside phosphorylase [Candidatus Sumerlaeota bacterium]|nr:purine-nucleoside phosphorylase [Candidatus Sumerlaeota bacterium]